MNPSVRHIGIVVSDMKYCLKFWCEVMRFRVLKELDEEGFNLDKMIGLIKVKIHTAKLIDENNNVVELIKYYSHLSKNKWNGSQYSTGLTHIAINVKDIEVIFNHIKNLYGDLGTKVCISDDGNVKMAYVNGPEGLLIELVEELNC